MSSPIIQVENLSKQYRLGAIGSKTLRDDLKRWWYRTRGKEDPFLKIGETNNREVAGETDYVWALRDVSFEVQPGEVLGIIGRNGAGKSTLLKILSRVTEPTTGRITMNGRVASLLEVGTGFHPELTGRENIYLNGAILGMTRREIDRKFDEIVDFAAIARYIDTPVKRYSSGMYVRLAFAVAAHLEPEILIVDEVLAVGDADFQKKALGRMEAVSRGEGRTVLFVSHNMSAVRSLCKKALLLQQGELTYMGQVDTCIARYQGATGRHHRRFDQGGMGNQLIVLHEIGMEAVDGDETSQHLAMELPSRLWFNIELKEPRPNMAVNLLLRSDRGEVILSSSSFMCQRWLQPGTNQVEINFPPWFFNAGQFAIGLGVAEGRRILHWSEEDVLHFSVSDEKRQPGIWMGRNPGFLRMPLDWKMEVSVDQLKS
jgi:lipopolysaccharide transport system ATP-binding protein